MPGPKRVRRERTEELASIKQWTLWPEQELYEQIRPIVLYQETAGERAKEIDVPQRTLARKAAAFERYGMASLFPSGCTKERSRLNIRPPRSRSIRCASRLITSRLKRVKNPRRIETHFRTPQLQLWQTSETE